jgi:3-deoxy-D-arabino-heptulosonate 7-phosphate (DAHP) synthase class II
MNTVMSAGMSVAMRGAGTRATGARVEVTGMETTVAEARDATELGLNWRYSGASGWG